MRSLIDLLRRRRARSGNKSRPPRPSVLLRRRRQLLLAIVCAGFALGLVAGTIWVRRTGYIDWAAARLVSGGEAAARAAGLTVREVYVVGRERTARQDLIAALAVERGSSMLAFDPVVARKRLIALGWIEEAEVYRRLPDVIEVQLVERRPLALWQNEGRLTLIDENGVVVLKRDLERFSNLPILVGPDAPAHAAELIGVLRIEPALFAKVEAAVRVGGRRWNIKMKNGVTVNLPESEARASWTRLARLDADHRLLDRSIEVIDLRLPDRLVVRMTPEAAAKRREPGKET